MFSGHAFSLDICLSHQCVYSNPSRPVPSFPAVFAPSASLASGQDYAHGDVGRRCRLRTDIHDRGTPRNCATATANIMMMLTLFSPAPPCTATCVQLHCGERWVEGGRGEEVEGGHTQPSMRASPMQHRPNGSWTGSHTCCRTVSLLHALRGI